MRAKKNKFSIFLTFFCINMPYFDIYHCYNVSTEWRSAAVSSPVEPEDENQDNLDQVQPSPV
jgi:hypothetical protein